MAFECTLVTPEQQAFSDKISQAILPAHDGMIGILTDRAPLLVKLAMGPLRLDSAGGQKQTFLIEGGVAQMKSNKLTILTQRATPASQITAQAGQAEIDAAQKIQGDDPKSAAERRRHLERARAIQQMAGGR